MSNGHLNRSDGFLPPLGHVLKNWAEAEAKYKAETEIKARAQVLRVDIHELN